MTTNVPLIRLVDDDELFRVSQMMLLKTRGWEVECYESGEDFLEKADLKRPGCIILDVRMEGLTGMQVHRVLVERGCKLAVIFLTGHGDHSDGGSRHAARCREFPGKTGQTL